MAKPKILFVEDDASIVALVQTLLTPIGAEIEAAGDISAAMAALEQSPPSAVLLDLILPSGNGLEVCRAIRKNDRWCDVPVIVVSARPAQRYMTEALEAGADDYVQKPFDLGAFEAKLRMVLRLSVGRRDRGAERFAHEIRNPLTAIRAAVGIIGRKDLARDRRDYLATAVGREADRVVLLVEEYLAERHTGSTVRVDVPIAPLLAEIVNLNLLGIQPRPSVRLDCPPELPAVRGDASRIRQIVLNLLLNAAEATRHMGGQIKICGCPEGEGVVLEISDSGPGIPAEVMPHIFDEHFTTRSEGDGLGLSIVRQIVEEEGGWIAVDSAPGTGTKFRVWLPST